MDTGGDESSFQMILGRVAVILGRSNTWVTVILGNAPANLGNAGLPLALTDTAHPHLFTEWRLVGLVIMGTCSHIAV